MADHVAVAVGGIYETETLIAVAIDAGAPRGQARADLDNTETRRGPDRAPWRPGPVETFHSVLLLTMMAMADHLNSTSQVLRADIDFGPMAMARCTTEAAGRIAWLLPAQGDVRTRVHRAIAARYRGMQDNAKNIRELIVREPEPADDLLAKSKDADQRGPAILTEAHKLGFKTTRNGHGQHDSLANGSMPSGGALAYEALKHVGVPLVELFYTAWSGQSHSSYDALRNALDIDLAQRRGFVRTKIATRIFAAGIACVAAIEALERLIMYFEVSAHPRVRIEPDLQAVKALMLQALDEGGAAQ
jgi:hypothetical protein